MSPVVDDQSRLEMEAMRARIAELEAQLAARGGSASSTSEDVTLGHESHILKAIIESCNDPIFMKDPGGRYVLVNSSAAEAFGMNAEECVGKTDFEVWPSDIAETFLKSDRSVLDSNQSMTFEQVLSLHGKQRTFLTTKTPCRDSKGNVIGIVGFARDITHRKQAEQQLRYSHSQLEERIVQRTQELLTANRILEEDRSKLADMHRRLRESHERFSVVANSIPVPIVITKISDDRVVFANLCALEQFHSMDDLIGQRSINFYHEPSDQKKLLERLEVEGSIRDQELRVRQVDGSLGYVAVSVSQIDFDSQPAMLAAYLDITGIKEAEESLRAERRHLRRAVDLYERDQQLTAYEIHDGIVQDLTAALMFLESHRAEQERKEDTSSTSLAKSKRLIQSSIDEARRLINGLRPPILEDEGIAAAVENLVTEIQTMHGLSVTLELQIEAEHLDTATEMAIYRIVQESINNVWQHSNSKEARIRLFEEDGRVNVVVQDWGCGFDAESIVGFESFGLRGIRERAKQLGGSAKIVSHRDVGTTILVTIPLESTPADDDSAWTAT